MTYNFTAASDETLKRTALYTILKHIPSNLYTKSRDNNNCFVFPYRFVPLFHFRHKKSIMVYYTIVNKNYLGISRSTVLFLP